MPHGLWLGRFLHLFYLLSDGGWRGVMVTAQPHKTTRFGTAMENTQDGHILTVYYAVFSSLA